MLETIQVLRHLLWLALFPLLTVIGGNAVLLSVPQARETLFALDDGHGASALRFLFFCAAYLYWAFTAWFCTRLMFGRIFMPSPVVGWNTAQLALGNIIARRLPRALGLVATVPLAVAMFRVGWVEGFVLTALAAAFLALVVLRHRLPWIGMHSAAPQPQHLRYFQQLPPRAWVFIGLLVGVSWLVFFVIWFAPVAGGRAIGSPALLLVALGGWTLFGSLALSYWPNSRAWPTLNWLPPLLFVAFSGIDNHPVADARHAVADAGWREARVELLDHFKAWIARHREGEPVYLVAVAGGASRAAFWAGMALGQLEDHARQRQARFGENLFMISAISGGSLGSAAFVTTLAAMPSGAVTPRIEAMLGRDFLAPVVGAMLYPDLAQRFLPVFDAIRATDRSLALEEAWIDDWRELAGNAPHRDWWAQPLVAPYAASAASAARLPSLVLNTVRLEDGQRMLQSNLKFELRDAFDLLDPRLATRHLTLAGAVHNSARFPYVSPAGRVRLPADPLRDKAPPVWGDLGDGGYHESAGAQTLADVIETLIAAGWIVRDGDRGLRACTAPSSQLERCPNPVVVIMLDNQPEAYGPNWRRGIDGQPLQHDALWLQKAWPVPEVSAPLMGLVRAWTSNTTRAEWRLARWAGNDPRAYIELRLPRCPGQHQPSMNWQLDDQSRALMKTAAQRGCGGEQAANLADQSLRANLARLRSWIDGSAK